MQSFDYYWKLTRPHTLPASVIPAVFGVCFAIYAEGIFHPLLAIIMVLCAALIQIATNLFNEYFDFKNGLDTEESVGIGGAIVREGISPRNVLIAAFVIATVFVVRHNGFTVKFDTDGGSHIDSVKVLHSETVPAVETPVKEGWQFAGWYTDRDCTRAWDIATDRVETSMTLYAKWQR